MDSHLQIALHNSARHRLLNHDRYLVHPLIVWSSVGDYPTAIVRQVAIAYTPQRRYVAAVYQRIVQTAINAEHIEAQSSRLTTLKRDPRHVHLHSAQDLPLPWNINRLDSRRLYARIDNRLRRPLARFPKLIHATQSEGVRTVSVRQIDNARHRRISIFWPRAVVLAYLAPIEIVLCVVISRPYHHNLIVFRNYRRRTRH